MTTYGTAIYNGTSYTLYGRPGSTLRDELNRLANGGEYPVKTSYKDEEGASNVWAGTPAGTGLLGSLNYKASSTRKQLNYKGHNAVCSELAGITDPAKYLEAVTALRTVVS